LSYASDFIVINALIDSVTLIFDLSNQNHIISTIFQGHSLYQVWTLRDHSFLSYAPDRQTDKQMDSNILPTPTDTVKVGN